MGNGGFMKEYLLKQLDVTEEELLEDFIRYAEDVRRNRNKKDRVKVIKKKGYISLGREKAIPA